MDSMGRSSARLLVGLLLLRFDWCLVSWDPIRFGLWGLDWFATSLIMVWIVGVFWCNQAVNGGGPAEVSGAFPLVVSTWPFREAVRAAWEVVSASDGGGSAVDAVVAGCSACEVLRCDGTGQSLARVIHLRATSEPQS